MGVRDVDDVDVVTYAGSVGSRIVVAEDVSRAAIESGSQDKWDQVGLGAVPLAKK